MNSLINLFVRKRYGITNFNKLGLVNKPNCLPNCYFFMLLYLCTFLFSSPFFPVSSEQFDFPSIRIKML